jgi:hypothetical protein
MRVAKTYFNGNCLAMYSRMGRLKKDKLKKPPFHPVQPPSGTHSAYYTEWKNLKEKQVATEFYESDKAVTVIALGNADTLYGAKNEINRIGRIDIRYKVGKQTLPALQYVPLYISEIDSREVTFVDLRNRLNALGCNFTVDVFDNSTFVKIHGIDSNLDSALKICHSYLYSLTPKGANKKFKRLLRETKRGARLERKQSLYYAQRLKEYALFGTESAYIKGYSPKMMKRMGTPALIYDLNQMFTYAADIYYSGPSNTHDLGKRFERNYKRGNGTNSKDRIPEKISLSHENIIYIYHTRKARQTHMAVLKSAGRYEPAKLPVVLAFNRYYGGDMSSLVFQEVREFRSLAYTAYGRIELPRLVNEEMYFETYAACQDDKTNETARVVVELANRMPEKPERTETIKNGLREYCRTAVPDHKSKPVSYVAWKRRGYTSNPYKHVYDLTELMHLSEIFAFYKSELQPKPHSLIVVGNVRKMNLKRLEEFGKVKKLKRKDFMKY